MTWVVASMGTLLGVALVAVWNALRNTGEKGRTDPNWLDDKYGAELEMALAKLDRGVIVQGRRGEIIRANDAANRILGLTEPQLTGNPGRHPTWTLDPDEGPPWPVESEAVSVTFYSGAPQTNVTTGIRRGDGQVRWISMSTVPLRARDGSVGYVLASFDDITETMDASESTVWHTLHDDLTALDNRVQLMSRMEHALARQARHGGSTAVLLCDIEQLKAVNDSHGRSYGDRVLVEVAERLRETARDSDTVARYRDDEFAIFIDDGDVEAALGLARRLQKALARPMTFEGASSDPVRLSIGIAKGAGSVDAMLAGAASALIQAKSDGQVRVFDSPAQPDDEEPTGPSARGAVRRVERRAGSTVPRGSVSAR